MLKIFISYSTRDLWAVETVRQALLGRQGLAVFHAEKSVRIGDDLPDKIRRNITLCDVFLLLWSQSAARSAWVQAEIGAAWGQKRLIIPVHLEPHVPLRGPLAGRTTKDVEIHQNPEQALHQLASELQRFADQKRANAAAWGWGLAGLILGGLLFGGGGDQETDEQDHDW